MARFVDRDKARDLRSKGKSYSEIKMLLGVSKSTLSLWLKDMPLSKEQIRSLRDLNPKRIENFRATMKAKRDARLHSAYRQAEKNISRLSEKELFMAGLFLYWGEGTKSSRGKISIANTDPAVIRFFLRWVSSLGVPREEIKIKLHVYADMDIEKEIKFWSKETSIPIKQFRAPYVKTSALSNLTYKNGFGHGTCNAIFENIGFWEYIMMALKYVRETEAGV